jgi:class 3 adenylate cyclase/HAMP domain-containing protein
MTPRPSSAAARLTWRTVLLAAAAGLLFAAAALAGRRAMPAPLDASYLAFANPSSLAVGPDGLILVNDSGDRRVVGFDLAGDLRFVVPGRRRSGYGFYNGRAIGFGSDGGFFIDDVPLDRATGNAERERLLSFGPDGASRGVAYAKAFTAEESADVTRRMIYTQATASGVAWFFPDAAGAWRLEGLDPAGKPLEARGFGGYDVYAAVDAAVDGAGAAYFLERSGQVRRAAAAGEPEPWFDNSAGLVRFPVSLTVAADGSVYVLDGKRSIVRIKAGPAGPTASVVLDAALAAAAGYDKPLALPAFWPMADGSLFVVNETASEIVVFPASGGYRAWSGARLTGYFVWLRRATLTALTMAVFFLAAALIMYYLKIFGSRARLLLKQLSILIPLTAAAAVGIAWSVYLEMNKRMEDQIADRLRHVAQLAAGRIDAAAVDRIDPSTARLEDLAASEDFLGVSAALDAAVNFNEDVWDANLFPYVYIRRGGAWYILGGFEYVELYPNAFAKPEFAAALDKGESIFYRYADSYGSWLSAMAPLERADGSPAAVVEASMGGDFIDELGRQALVRVSLGTAGLLAALVAVFALFNWMLLRSVAALRRGAERVSGGDYDVKVAISSKDEIEELGDAFNAMSGQVKDYVQRLARLNEANSRFVPTQFLSQLGRDSITEIGLGDQVLTDMTVLFSDIRAFTSLAERLGPTATIDLLNDYLARIGPAVRASDGFIDKYIGDAVLALFPRRPADAVSAAQAMMAALDDFGAELASRGEPVVDAGFGLHSGPLMLGIIGEAERFEGTVIADAVNLASRLESLTKFYGVRAILSADVKAGLHGPGTPLRFLDVVQVKGKTKPVRIFELIGPGDGLKEAKLAAAAEYVRGFEAYRLGRAEAAAAGFAAALAVCPDDPPSLLMVERCRRYAADGFPAAWRGVMEFHEK